MVYLNVCIICAKLKLHSRHPTGPLPTIGCTSSLFNYVPARLTSYPATSVRLPV